MQAAFQPSSHLSLGAPSLSSTSACTSRPLRPRTAPRATPSRRCAAITASQAAPQPVASINTASPASAVASADAVTAPPAPDTPYPVPTGVPGVFSALARDALSIPALFRNLSTHPRLADLPALVDDHHVPAATLTFADMGRAVTNVTAALRSLALSSGDIVAFFSENSHRWFVVDQAIMSCGAAAAVRGVDAPLSELEFIFRNSQSGALCVEDLSALRRVLDAGIDLTNTKFVIMLFGSSVEADSIVPAGVQVISYDHLIDLGTSFSSATKDTQDAPSRSDVATLLYTSGTTGNPKGVVLTHNNILNQLANICLGSLDPRTGEVFLSVLPCWHVFERTAAYWSLSKGVSLVYSSKRTFRDDLAKYRPHMLISVPRVFENLHATIMARLRNASALRKALFAFFFAVTLMFVKSRRRVRGLDVTKKFGLAVRLVDALRMAVLAPLAALANLLIWRKIRGGVGGRLRICLSGGGSIAGYLEDFFECAGIDICVGYGLTETAPVIANRFGEHNVRGTTGMPVRCVEVKLVSVENGARVTEKGAQGVLQVRGPSIFREYWQNAEATSKEFDAEGFFSTGDLAYYGPGGDIVICGRDKDMIVLSNGENIEPAAIEDALLASGWIDQVMLVGQDERGLGALIVPSLDGLEEAGVVSKEMRVRVEELVALGEDGAAQLSAVEQELEEDERFAKAMREEIKEKNMGRVNYTGVDKIMHMRVVLQPFSVENGMLTQTLKIKKATVSKDYAQRIASMYQKS